MTFPPAFLSGTNVRYPVQNYSVDGQWQHLLTNLQIACNASNDKDNFPAKTYDVFNSYNLTFNTKAAVDKWLRTTDMGLYQSQLHMAVWCATSGCGVSVQDHLQNDIPFVASFFRFHMYYQIRKILHQLRCPIPGDDNFDRWKNRIDQAAYATITAEFNIPNNSDFRYHGGDNKGLGTTYMGGYPIHGTGYADHRSNYYFPSDNPSFADRYHMVSIDKLAQSDPGWTSFMLPKSDGLTRAGIVRLNDSLRTYVYCILGSQAQTRAPIIGSGGTSLDAQAQFLVLLDDCINQANNLSLPDMIKRYEDSITATKKRLDYAIGPDLYMIPSDMILNVGTVEGYNNNVTVATRNMKFGVNPTVNNQKTPSKKAPHLSAVPPKTKRVSNVKPPAPVPRPTPEISTKTPQVPIQPLSQTGDTSHSENKAYLVLGIGAAVGLGVAYFNR